MKLEIIEGYGRCKVCGYVFNIKHFEKFGHWQEREKLMRNLSPCCGAIIEPYCKREGDKQC